MESKSKGQTIAAVLLARAHDTDDAKRILTDKIQQRPLFLTPSSPPPSDARAARRRALQKKTNERRKANKPRPLSASQRRKLGLYDVPRQGQKYELFKPLNRLWVNYMCDMLQDDIYSDGEGLSSTLCSADFHGASVEVIRSKCVSRVGIRGIIIKDSLSSFEIITEANRLKLVPKEGTVFRFEVPVPVPAPTNGQTRTAEDAKGGGPEIAQDQQQTMAFELFGDQFQLRSADRASKKFKNHFMGTL
ncbi:Rof/RNase P-like protein [Bombardia bombarda]|uniref:Ribonuclease P protein subunit n=1 Tax=Bombardia bombarda TaxID=252184 RepID=A0AA40C195_9PEZI|nr:Rof/RNase P-like protein [Bombardia bombarda]